MDASSIAKAYRDVNDEDTRQVLNCMSAKRTKLSLDNLKFFIVPRSWMEKAWPVLSGSEIINPIDYDKKNDHLKDHVGRIQNRELLLTSDNNAVSISSSSDEISSGDDDDDNEDKEDNHNKSGNNFGSVPLLGAKLLRKQKRLISKRSASARRKRAASISSLPLSLRRDIYHERDFCLLGPRTWALVKSHFGCEDDIELGRPCGFTSHDNTISVLLHEDQQNHNIGIDVDVNDEGAPENDNTATTSICNDSAKIGKSSINRLGRLAPKQIIVPPSGRFAYEKIFSCMNNLLDNNYDNKSENNIQPVHQTGDVVSEDEGTDLFPGYSDDHESFDQQDQGKVVLLPPSTSTSPDNCRNNHVYPSVQEMDFSTTADMEESTNLDAENINGTLTDKCDVLTANCTAIATESTSNTGKQKTVIASAVISNTNMSNQQIMADEEAEVNVEVMLNLSKKKKKKKKVKKEKSCDNAAFASSSGGGKVAQDSSAQQLLLTEHNEAQETGDPDGCKADYVNDEMLKRYGSGLGNLGNTCFMNSTLQCLANTYPLRRYFLSGEYERDLNRANPLGTGGDLAIQFAQLLAEMWGAKTSNNTSSSTSSRRAVIQSNHNNNNGNASSSVVYPRNFKYTLGKHAEQFMGYDQHDSQELATYLLDALHEDTNRVTKKPYIEKPEQGEDEPDHVAATKAWDLHLQREDSRVLENFMGQIKSRVRCCEEGCGRVSTTFDPFMYLSVPIPGSTERTIRITYVPCDSNERMKSLSIILSKTDSIGKLLKNIIQHLEKNQDTLDIPVLEDLCPADVWNNEVYNWYCNDDCVDRIRDSDETYVFQLRPLPVIHEMYKETLQKSNCEKRHAVSLGLNANKHVHKLTRYKLDITTLTRLNKSYGWMEELVENYVRPSKKSHYHKLFNVTTKQSGSASDQTKFYKKLESFIALCITEIETLEQEEMTRTPGAGTSVVDEDKAGIKRAREESNINGENKNDSAVIDSSAQKEQRCLSARLPDIVSPDEDVIIRLQEPCDSSNFFHDVKKKYDLGILEFCLGKLRRFILDSSRCTRDTSKYKDGILIQIINRKNTSPSISGVGYSSNSNKAKSFATPLILRIPANMIVYNLREELANRLKRSLLTPEREQAQRKLHRSQQREQISLESTVVPMEGDFEKNSNISDSDDVNPIDTSSLDQQQDNTFGDPTALIMRQIPLCYTRKSVYTYKTNYSSKKTLGMIEKPSQVQQNVGSRPIATLANPTDENELQMILDVVGPKGTVYLDWPFELCERSFDLNEYDSVDEIGESSSSVNNSKKKNQQITVLDCVEKFCQIEQLEETEMWYCNKCQNHVRAWKQFHLYRTPPILIIHLKRFHYSSSTHRRNKIGTFIDFPLEGLDLTKHAMHYTESDKPIYDCYAVSNHYGGLGGGHYTAYAFTDGVWCHYDDSRITTNVDPKEVLSEAAYVLYYRRRDVVVNEDYLNEVFTKLAASSPALIQDTHQIEEAQSEISSSSNGVNVGNDDNMDVDDIEAASRGSSKTCSSPMGSMTDDNVGDHPMNEDEHSEHDKVTYNDDDHVARCVNHDDYENNDDGFIPGTLVANRQNTTSTVNANKNLFGASVKDKKYSNFPLQ